MALSVQDAADERGADEVVVAGEQEREGDLVDKRKLDPAGPRQVDQPDLKQPDQWQVNQVHPTGTVRRITPDPAVRGKALLEEPQRTEHQASDTERRNEQSVSEKESGRWIEAYQSAARLAEAMPQTQLTVCGDRESDIFELFDQSEVAPRNLRLLVRAQHDRLLSSGQKLWHQLREQPLGGTLTVRVPRRGDRPARVATLEVRWLALEAASPRVALKKSWSPIRLWAVLARELDPPPGPGSHRVGVGDGLGSRGLEDGGADDPVV